MKRDRWGGFSFRNEVQLGVIGAAVMRAISSFCAAPQGTSSIESVLCGEPSLGSPSRTGHLSTRIAEIDDTLKLLRLRRLLLDLATLSCVANGVR
jgi:hypothetical protein